jgi:hypothetical protein
LGRAHHRHARLARHGADVLEIDVDQSRYGDDVRDAGDRLGEHLVSGGKRLLLGDIVAQNFLEAAIQDDDQRVDASRQRRDAFLGHAHAPRAFEFEGLGDDADGQDGQLTRDFGDHGGSAGAGAAPHACGEEYMSAPLSASAMTVRSRMALSRPTIGSLPAPRPLSPSWIRVSVRVFESACASVFAQINSKAGSAEDAIWLMALPPAPPMPIILITVSG